ncbi:MAG: heparin lyase I family protein [Planctomycetota bacterium]
MAGVIFVDGFESGTIDTTGPNWRGEWWTGVPGAERISTVAAGRSGRGAMRASLWRNDEFVSNSNRSEIRKTTHSSDAMGMGNNGDTRYYRWNVFVPNDYEPDLQSQAFEIVGQIHRGPKPGVAWRSPPLAIEIKEGRWHISGNTSAGNYSHDAGVVEPGRWTEWMIRADWSPTNTGDLRVWKDGDAALHRANAPNTWGTDYATGDHFLKVGLYKPEWADTDTSFPVRSDRWQNTFLFDEIRVGDQNETETAMRTPGSPNATELFRFGTHEGVGADAQVMGQGSGRDQLNVGGSARSETRGNAWNGGEYATYLRFDLSDLSLPVIADATLQLVVERDAAHTLDVYAVPDGFAGRADGNGSDELGETAWAEGNKSWSIASGNELDGDNAPGFDEVAGAPDTSVLELVGSVTLDEALHEDSLIEISTQSLIQAVSRDTNGQVTLAVFARDQSGVSTWLRTKEAGSAFAPSLEVIARGFNNGIIPEPATGLVFLWIWTALSKPVRARRTRLR